MKKKILIGALILVAVAVVLAFTVLKGGNGNGEVYKKEAISRGKIEALVDTTGSLNAVTMVDVGSQVSGKISEIYVDFNSVVKAGQIIANIDPEMFKTRVNQNQANFQSAVARLEKAKVTLDTSKKKYERALNLFEKKLISDEEMETVETNYYGAKSDLQSAEASLEQAKSTLESSKVDLGYTIIKSPIDGVVINRNVNVGQTVAASMQAPVLFQIANDLSQMQVECSVDEADIGKVKEGQKVRFTVDAFPNENFDGKVKQVRYSPEVVSNVVTYMTIVEVQNPELKLRPGMTATVSIVVGEAENALRVPNSALRYNPPQEVLMALMQEMRQKRAAKSGEKAQPDGQRAEGSPQRPSPGGDQSFRGMMGGSRQGTRNRNAGRVWIEDAEGKLRMIFIRTGVTDNVYTEITGGDLEESMEVITGVGSASSSSSNRNNNPMRMMRFMR